MTFTTAHSGDDRTLGRAVDEAITRTLAVAALGAIALIHILQLPEAFDEADYLGAMFVGAVVASVLLAVALTRTGDARVLGAAGGLAGLILIGYLLSRTSGLPAATNDIGEWTEPLGLASMVFEGLLVCLAAAVMATSRTPATLPADRTAEMRGRGIPGTRPHTSAG